MLFMAGTLNMLNAFRTAARSVVGLVPLALVAGGLANAVRTLKNNKQNNSALTDG